MAYAPLTHSELLKRHAVELTQLAMEASDAPYRTKLVTDAVDLLLMAAEMAERAELAACEQGRDRAGRCVACYINGDHADLKTAHAHGTAR